jgi:hypothetical protein
LRHDIEIAKIPVEKKKQEMDEQQKWALVERFAYYEELPEEEESEADILVSNSRRNLRSWSWLIYFGI